MNLSVWVAIATKGQSCDNMSPSSTPLFEGTVNLVWAEEVETRMRESEIWGWFSSLCN